VNEIVRLLDYGFASGFSSPVVKRRLRADALHETLKILMKNDIDISGVISDPYFSTIGVDYTELGLKPADNIIIPGILKGKEPELTEEILKALPKTDLHCRFDGSVPSKNVWADLQESKIDLKAITGTEIKTFEEFDALLSKLESSANNEDISLAKKITTSVLQTKAQLERACSLLVEKAVSDNVKYLELIIRPFCHINGELKTGEEVIDIIQNKLKELIKKFDNKILVGIVIYSSNVNDDPLSFNQLAQLAIKYAEQPDTLVVGFGNYGDSPLKRETIKYFQNTFDLLKEHRINVAIASGYTNAEDIVSAIHDGGASRISGAFSLDSRPAVMQYLAQNEIPVEIGWTPKMKCNTSCTFSGNFIRVLVENSIPISICSFRAKGDLGATRSNSLLEVAHECKMSFADLCKLLSNGFYHNFLHLPQRQKLISEFWKECSNVAKKFNFSIVISAQPFPK